MKKFKLNQSKSGLFRATTWMSAMTLISRIMGFVRDMIIAIVFGAGAGVDAFLVAFKIPNTMRVLFAEGAFSQAFVPILSDYQVNQSVANIRLFVNRTLGNLLLVLLPLIVIMMLIAPLLIMVFAPGFYQDISSERYGLAVSMLHWTAGYLPCIAVVALLSAVLNVQGSYGFPASSPIWLNVSLIVAAIWSQWQGSLSTIVLAQGVFVAGLIQLCFLWLRLYWDHWVIVPHIHWSDPGVKQVLKLMGPVFLGASVMQLNELIDMLFASFLPPGSVTWLYYTERLVGFPLGIFGVTLATVTLPHLSRGYIQQSWQSFHSILHWAMQMIWIIAIPSTIVLCLLGKPLLVMLFHRGAFTLQDVQMVYNSLLALSVGLPAFMLVKMLSTAFYAQQDVMTPVRIAIVSVAVNAVLNAVLVRPFAHAGLALATSLSAYLQAGWLWYRLKSKTEYQPMDSARRFGWFIVLAGLIMIVLVWANLPSMTTWCAQTPWSQIRFIFIILGLGGLSYGTIAYSMGYRWRDLQGPW